MIAIDLPGFGASSRAWQENLLEGYVDVVREVLDAEGITDPVSLVGNSMGAAVSTLFAARYPERTARIVLTDMPGLHSVPRLWDLALSRPTELGLRTAFRVVPESGARYGLGWAYGRIAAADRGRLDPSVLQGFTLALPRPRQRARTCCPSAAHCCASCGPPGWATCWPARRPDPRRVRRRVTC